MGINHSKGTFTPEIAEIQRETGFTLEQIFRLQKRFSTYDRDNDNFLRRDDFLVQPTLATNPLSNSIINLMFSGDDKPLDQITFKQFTLVLSRFLPENTQNCSHLNSSEEKLKFLFKLFDKDCDGYVSQGDLNSVLTMLIGSQVPVEQLDKIVDQTIGEADSDQDGKVSFSEFSKIMAKVDINKKMTLHF
ncbi:hypothetical protein HELRODRAFT_65191 [Helobdella robusta]|uniref:EF-hand domain-containing protein n=1 Tax=Helobdella robusta TaxID=6412 RepID=T1FY44_HELRO|nr:hypothetical protein HELRODRAFT_65191 [Helobdella robusta]ESO02037.1 hypothetical protein HELRODRAFT_65191 [Helobdella robusta]